MSRKHNRDFRPDSILAYFRLEWLPIALITVSGLIYNIGLLAGPWFEGRLAQCLADILGGSETASAMAAAVSARWVPPRSFNRACSAGEKTRCTKAGFCSFAAMRSAAQRSVPMPKIILSPFSFQLNANSNSAALSFSTRPSITAVSSRCRVAPTAGPAGRPASIRSPPFTASWRMV